MKKVTTLILPIAGLGKRLLPLTEKTPKNLVKVNGKPLLEYVLEEAVASGIKKVVLVVNPKNIGDFKAYVAKNKKRFPSLAFFIRVQPTPGGNGHAIAQAYDLIKDEPFAVRFCDDVLIADTAKTGNPSALHSLIGLFERMGGGASVILLERVPKNMVSRFGVVGYKTEKNSKKGNMGAQKMFAGGGVYEITNIIEKPKPSAAPSNLTIVGGYVFAPEIVRNLRMVADTLPVIADDALPVAVAIQMELAMHGKVYGWEFPGTRLDCGTLEKLKQAEEFLKAVRDDLK
jgi:UTP--glucose-1-phosphate uridylyltransferase